MSDDTIPGRIRNAALTIRQCWPHMIPDSPPPVRPKVVIGKNDYRPVPDVIPPHTLKVRAEALAQLAGWCLVIIEDRELNTVIDGNNAHQMSWFIDTHADYLAEHPAVDDALAELEDSARRCENIASPPNRDSLLLGDCPVTIAVDGTSQPCGGKVRAYADRGFAVCRSCGTEDTTLWWESQILGDQDANVLADAPALAAHLSRIHHRIVPPSTIRSWATKGMLDRRGKDTKGRTLYDRKQVVEVAEEQFNKRRDTRRGA